MLLLREGRSARVRYPDSRLTEMQVTGDIWERFIKLIEQDELSEGSVMLTANWLSSED